MKKSLIYTSLLLIGTNLIHANSSHNTSTSNVSNISSTTSLTTKAGIIFQGNQNGLKILNNITLLKQPIFKSNTNLNIYALAEQSDGKIIVGGDFDTVNGYKVKDIVRLNLDGSVDKGASNVSYFRAKCTYGGWFYDRPHGHGGKFAASVDGYQLNKQMFK